METATRNPGMGSTRHYILARPGQKRCRAWLQIVQAGGQWASVSVGVRAAGGVNGLDAAPWTGLSESEKAAIEASWNSNQLPFRVRRQTGRRLLDGYTWW